MPIVDMDTLRNDNAEPQEEFLTDEEQDAIGGEPEEEGHKRVKAYVDQSTDDIVVAELSDTKFPVVNKNWAKTAKALFDIYRNDLCCNPATILFLEIKESKAKFKGQPKFFEVTTISKMWQSILKQLTGKNFTHIIKIHAGNIEKFDQSIEMCLIHLYNEMRKIKADGSLGDYTVKGFPEVMAHLKSGWNKEGSVIPNLIDAGSWAAMRQLQTSLFEDRSGENALAKSK